MLETKLQSIQKGSRRIISKQIFKFYTWSDILPMMEDGWQTAKPGEQEAGKQHERQTDCC